MTPEELEARCVCLEKTLRLTLPYLESVISHPQSPWQAETAKRVMDIARKALPPSCSTL